jgi:hypothetical protein
MEEYAKYFDTLVDISRQEAAHAFYCERVNVNTRKRVSEADASSRPRITDLKDAPSTRRRVTPLTPPARSPLGGPEPSSPSYAEATEGWPDIIVDTDGCIVLCTECDSSSIGRSSDGYQCFRCGNHWSRI